MCHRHTSVDIKETSDIHLKPGRIMKQLFTGMLPQTLCVVLHLFVTQVFSGSVPEDLNAYFVDLDEDFARIVDAGALRSTNLRQAERLFIREMRKKQAYFTFLRTNSRGVIISEVIRGDKVERPMRDVSGQRWFRRVSRNKEAYYTLIKDNDRGRYYLFWCRPILKRGNRFIGSVVAKIDLWDSFYEFSESIYYPFLIKLGRKSLFSHKWKEGESGTENRIDVQGIAQISVIYSSEAQKAEPSVAAAKEDSVKQPAAATVDTAKNTKEEKKAKKKKGSSGLLVFLLVVLILGIAVTSFMLITWMRRRAFLKRLDEDDL